MSVQFYHAIRYLITHLENEFTDEETFGIQALLLPCLFSGMRKIESRLGWDKGIPSRLCTVRRIGILRTERTLNATCSPG